MSDPHNHSTSTNSGLRAERRIEALADEYLERLLAGETPDRQAFLNAHLDLADLLEPRLALVELMHRVARAEKQAENDTTNQSPSAPPAERSLRVTCPHCGNGIQLVESVVGEVTCNGCGSSFLVDPRDTTVHHITGMPKTIGKFTILEQLGRGAFGTVYKARDPELQRLVAVKVPRAGSFGSAEEEERFLREARATAQLSHPGIVPVLEIAHDSGVPYIVSEYVEGLTLADILTGRRPAFRESAELVAAVAEALDYAHRRKIVHRDVKPSNLLIDHAGAPHVTDFGLARRGEGEITVTLDGQVLGTPAYMAPEQAAGDQQRVDARSDVYSLGVVLYELLAGELPFRGNQRMLLHQVLHDEPKPPRSLNDRVPRDLETICLKAMAKVQGKRYASALEMAVDLRRYLNGEAIVARRVGRIERAWRWSRRNPVGAAMIALIVFWAVSMSVLSWIVKREKDTTEKARLNSDVNAALASARGKEAKDHEERAEKEAELARKLEKMVKIANNQHQISLDRITIFSEEIQRYLQQMGTQFSVQRKAILNLLRKNMMMMAHDLESSEAISFATAGSYERMGWQLKRLGQSEEALKQYRLAVKRIEKSVAEQPDSDMGRANLALARTLVADMKLDLDADFRTARDTYERMRQLRQEIADHPRSNELNELENKINLAHYHRRLALAELGLGDSASARDQLKKAFELRNYWVKVRPDQKGARSYLMEIHVLLGVASSRLGDDKSASEEFTQARTIGEDLVSTSPAAHWYKADMAVLLGHMGDAETRLAKTAEAEKSYQQALNYLKPELERLPGNAANQLEQALILERLALIAEIKGNAAEAKKIWEKALGIRRELLEIEPKNLLWLTGALRASAHCGRFPTAVRQLEMHCRRHPHSIPILLDTAQACAVGVAMSSDAATKQRYVERAIGALHTAVRAGYKDSFALKTDPELASLTKEPLFASLLAEMPK